jgi:outer membrane protein assembly factor BamB
MSNFENAHSPYEVSAKNMHQKRFEPYWKTSIGTSSGEHKAALSHPVSDGTRVFASDGDGKISALNARDGKILWTTSSIAEEEIQNAMPANLAYDQGSVFAATSVGSLHCLDAATGTITWSVNMGAPVRVMPGIKDGRVFITTIDGRTLAYATKTGERLWDHQGLNDITNILGGASPVIKDDVVIVTYSSGEIYALKTDSGAVVWSDTVTTSLRSDSIASIPHIVGNPIIEGHILYVTSHGGKTIAYDLTTGLSVWKQDLGSVTSPILLGNYLFILESQNRLVCLEKSTGRIHWIAVMPLDQENKPTKWSAPLGVNDRLVLSSKDGRVIFVDPAQGSVTSTMAMNESITTQPIVADGKLIYMLDSGYIVAG